MRIIGIDPGLRKTGWGIVEINGNALKGIDCGTIEPNTKDEFSVRLAELFRSLNLIIEKHQPKEASVEKIIVNSNAISSLKLGHARAVALLCPALSLLPVFEYAPNTVKKATVGVGHADKEQVKAMMHRLVPAMKIESYDAADALAIAICHAHSRPRINI